MDITKHALCNVGSKTVYIRWDDHVVYYLYYTDLFNYRGHLPYIDIEYLKAILSKALMFDQLNSYEIEIFKSVLDRELL